MRLLTRPCNRYLAAIVWSVRNPARYAMNFCARHFAAVKNWCKYFSVFTPKVSDALAQSIVDPDRIGIMFIVWLTDKLKRFGWIRVEQNILS